MNGKRLGVTNDGLQDVASIPAAMVERIEVLKDGASTIYGSDAIAGVVNIITRKNFEGAEANAYIGQWGEGDGTRQVYDFTMGFTGDRGSLTAGVEYTKEDPVYARDRWFGVVRFPTGEKSPPRPGGTSAVNQWGTLIDQDGNLYNLIRDGQSRDPRDFGNFRPYDPALDNSNPNLQSTIYSGIERKSIFLNGRYDITDSISFETDVLYTDRESFAQNAGYPYQSGAFGTPMSVDSYFNPLGSQNNAVNPQAVDFFRRGWEVPRGVQNNLTTYRFTGAFKGSFEIAEKFWDWDAGYLYNQNKGVQISTGNLNTQAVGLAVGPSFLNSSGQVQCGTPDDPIALGFGPGACTPWNPFTTSGANSLADPAVQAYLYLPGQALSETETTNYFANLTGALFTLPAGDLAMAVGVEHRKEEGFFSPDALAQTGISTDLAAGPTAGGYSLDEAYLEFQVPVLADVPFAQELTLSLASRYSDYDTFGDTTNNKFGFKWRPIDSLLVRGTMADGFRAPTVADLFGGLSQSFEFYTDPCDTSFGAGAGNARCSAAVPANFRQPAQGGIGDAPGPGTQTPIPFLSGSNPNLTPETSESKTLGLVWSPDFVQGLNMTLDWWNIRIENTIVADDPTEILNDCYLRGIDSRCSSTLFTRDPATGDITFLQFGGRNAGFREAEGYDFDLTYRLDTDWGRFGVAWLSTYVVKNELKADNSENPPSQQNGFGGNFRVRSNLNLSWDQGPFGVTWSSRYYSSSKEQCFFDDICNMPNYTAPELQGSFIDLNKTGSNTFHDVQFRWNAPWNATVAIGANNVFEHYSAPYYSQPNSGFAYYGGYDIGRFVYMKYQQRF